MPTATQPLLALLPLLLAPPPAPTPAAFATTATSSTSPTQALGERLHTPTVTHYNEHSRRERALLQHLRGYPGIDGRRITREWVQGLPMEKARWRFGFIYEELAELVEALRLPEVIVTPSRNRFDCFEALALTCARFRSACSQLALSIIYRRQQSASRL